MISIIYPYRNRNLKSVRNSLNSLKIQENSDFHVFFVDYGSDLTIADQARELCESFSFISYRYYPVQNQPWNKSKALNSVIKNLNGGHCFVADVDMIFHPDFTKIAEQLQRLETTVYFQVGFLSSRDQTLDKKFSDFKDYRKSTSEATGLSLLPVSVLKKLRGFDEFYHFWGAEDTDMHIRLKNEGYKVKYYDSEVLMLHQWHPSYRCKEDKSLTEDLQIDGIVQLNHQHLKFAEQFNVTKVNLKGWGEVPSKEVMQELLDTPVNLELINEKRQIDDLLYGQLPLISGKNLKILIKKDPLLKSQKYSAKKLLRKKVPIYYSLKEVNDLVLLHLICFYRDKPYYFQVSTSNNFIEFAIKL